MERVVQNDVWGPEIVGAPSDKLSVDAEDI